MILPVYAYGQPVLNRKGKEVAPDHEGLITLIANMWETMYNAKGIGIAAPQVGRSLRLFVVDTVQLEDEENEFKGIKKVFINPTILEESGKEWAYEEGCLSIPNIHGDVERLSDVKISYFDEDFNEIIETYDGMNARVIQHEYDHIDGVLFTDKLKPLKKKMLSRKLEKLKKGKSNANYRLKFYEKR